MPRRTDSNNPADWLYLSGQDLAGIRKLTESEVGYEMCRGKLAEVIEKLMKAELIRLGLPRRRRTGEHHNSGADSRSRFPSYRWLFTADRPVRFSRPPLVLSAEHGARREVGRPVSLSPPVTPSVLTFHDKRG